MILVFTTDIGTSILAAENFMEGKKHTGKREREREQLIKKKDLTLSFSDKNPAAN